MNETLDLSANSRVMSLSAYVSEDEFEDDTEFGDAMLRLDVFKDFQTAEKWTIDHLISAAMGSSPDAVDIPDAASKFSPLRCRSCDGDGYEHGGCDGTLCAFGNCSACVCCSKSGCDCAPDGSGFGSPEHPYVTLGKFNQVSLEPAEVDVSTRLISVLPAEVDTSSRNMPDPADLGPLLFGDRGPDDEPTTPVIACLAIVCHGHVVGGRHSPHFLPSVPVDHNEDPHCSANRLAADLLLDTENYPLTSIQHTAVSQGCVAHVFMMNARTPDGDLLPLLEQL